MGRFDRSGRARRAISKQETKTCPLCGTLNYEHNAECFTCGWHGGFEQDAAAKDYQWQCLVERFEEVRLEHLVARGAQVVSEFGVVRKSSRWQRWTTAWARCWQGFLVRRNARCAERTAALRPQTSSRPH